MNLVADHFLVDSWNSLVLAGWFINAYTVKQGTVQEIKWELFSAEIGWRGSSMQNSVVCVPEKNPNASVWTLWKLWLLPLLRIYPANGPESGSFSRGLMLGLGNRWPFTGTAGAGSHVCLICLERRSSMSWFMMRWLSSSRGRLKHSMPRKILLLHR